MLMPDHATLGGYPMVAVVTTADHGLLGQCGPGTEVSVPPRRHAPKPSTPGASARRRLEATTRSSGRP